MDPSDLQFVYTSRTELTAADEEICIAVRTFYYLLIVLSWSADFYSEFVCGCVNKNSM